MATLKILVIFTILLVAIEFVSALSDSIAPRHDDLKSEPQMNHETVYPRVKRQFSNYPYGYGNGGRTPIPIILGGVGFGGRNLGGRGFGAGRGAFGIGRGGLGVARGGFGGGRGRG